MIFKKNEKGSITTADFFFGVDLLFGTESNRERESD